MKKSELMWVELVLNVLVEVCVLFDDYMGIDWGYMIFVQKIDEILYLVYVKLWMQFMCCEWCLVIWLVQLISMVWLQEIVWCWNEELVMVLCFEVKIIDGVKDVVGWKVEVCMLVNDVDFLVMLMKGMVEWGKGRFGFVSNLGELLFGGFIGKEME